jgi:hypothetical protein
VNTILLEKNEYCFSCYIHGSLCFQRYTSISLPISLIVSYVCIKCLCLEMGRKKAEIFVSLSFCSFFQKCEFCELYRHLKVPNNVEIF